MSDDDMRSVRELAGESYFKIVASRFWTHVSESLYDGGGGETPSDWLRTAHLHWSDLHRNQWEGDVELLEVPGTSWGDQGGDAYNRSNHRVLLENYPDTFVQVGYSTHDGMALYLPMDAEIPQYLYDELLGLDDYPLLDESDHSELEMELEQEDWDHYGRDDFRRDVERILEDSHDVDGFDADEASPSDADLDARAYRAMGDGDLTWEGETATNGYFRGLDELGRKYAREILDAHHEGLDELARSLTAAQYVGMAPLI